MRSEKSENPLLKISNLRTYFKSISGVARAVDDVSFSIHAGEILGIVGESGCGKSVTANSIMKLVPSPPGEIVGGSIRFSGMNLVSASEKEMQKIRGNRISMIFQEPMTSLNPVKTIAFQIEEMFKLHSDVSRQDRRDLAVEMLNRVHIPDPENRMKDYPFQLSGGMRQRIMIAISLSCNPEMLIADEPTTALDVTVQAQIIDLMLELQEKYHMAIMMITHDLGVIAEMASRVLVMYAGKIVEQGPVRSIFENPQHPYTQGLLKSIPILGQASTGTYKPLNEIKGIVPSLYESRQGCLFGPRCPISDDDCQKQYPESRTIDNDHEVSCWKAAVRV